MLLNWALSLVLFSRVLSQESFRDFDDSLETRYEDLHDDWGHRRYERQIKTKSGGKWKHDWASMVRTTPKSGCDPPCQNGGICHGQNLCQCTQDFMGPQCQHKQCIRPPAPLNAVTSCVSGVCRISCLDDDMAFPDGTSEANLVCKDGKWVPSNPDWEMVPNCQEFTPIPIERNTAECYTWDLDHYKTFDGKVFSFGSECVFLLATNVNKSFAVHTPRVRPNCNPALQLDCVQVGFYVWEKKYTLTANDKGRPIILDDNKSIPIPVQLPGLRAEMKSNTVAMTVLDCGVNIIWDYMFVVKILVNEWQSYRTSGLCGNYDGNATNDLGPGKAKVVKIANKYLIRDVACVEDINDESQCTENAKQRAEETCSKMLNNKIFGSCKDITYVLNYRKACLWDFCTKPEVTKNIGCKTIEMFVAECRAKGVDILDWRDNTTCPITCSGGKVYMKCGQDETCGSVGQQGSCYEGCFCPQGMFLKDGKCITQQQCPCQLNGAEYPSGHIVNRECSSCKCMGGSWTCNPRDCSARCTMVGDPHYKTFDGRAYDFMGKCSYYLVVTENFTVQAENVPCAGHHVEGQVFPAASLPYLPSCIKSVTIKLTDGTVIHLKPKRVVFVNDEEQKLLPLKLKKALIRMASSSIVQVQLEGGMEVNWDGNTLVYVKAPGEFKGKTMGLCGTFNGNLKDDFLTPNGDVEQDIVSFATKWQTKDQCYSPVVPSPKHPCDLNPENKAFAVESCSLIKSKIFESCHLVVGPNNFYDNCVFDMCICSGSRSECLCSIIADYAKECSAQGEQINWREQIPECLEKCPVGQEWQTCASSCSRSCHELSRQTECKPSCVEGCNCPNGTLFDNSGNCIKQTECPCFYNGKDYPAGKERHSSGKEGDMKCKCIGANWDCEPLLDGQSSEPVDKDKPLCNEDEHQMYTDCLPHGQITCQNLHQKQEGEKYDPTCNSGCICQTGYILDTSTSSCIRPEKCPCKHGQKNFNDGEKIQNDCNTCICNGGKWTCTDRLCPGVCKAFGDSHFESFDGKLFDFQGNCDYLFSEGIISDSEKFRVSVKILPCESKGQLCTKSIALSVGEDPKDRITFSENEILDPNFKTKRIKVREAGLFLFADVVDLGIVLQWDKGTTIMLRANPQWKSKLRGICGNFNGQTEDDFTLPGGKGLQEAAPHLFADSWKLNEFCPQAFILEDSCESHPDRRKWAEENCAILNSELFKLCHSEVDVGPYYKNCMFDTCICESAKDCDYLCNAISAYGQACNSHNVPVKWRSSKFCPLQCEEKSSSYNPCISTCPPPTCDNMPIYVGLTAMCSEDICVEGCEQPACPEGQIFTNLTDKQCTPAKSCKELCMTIDGKEYYEGDIIDSDDCYSCVCSKQKKVCQGEPCDCPIVKCPPGFEKVLGDSKEFDRTLYWSPFGTKTKWSAYGVKGERTNFGSNQTERDLVNPTFGEPTCLNYVCKSLDEDESSCPKLNCDPGFKLVTMSTKKEGCPQQSCVGSADDQEPDAKCSITGKIFNTFDGMEYKHDICDHILARDMVNKMWEIKQLKLCSGVDPCQHYLVIHQGNHKLVLNPDLSVTFNGYNYTVEQMQKIGAQSEEFAVKQVSDNFIIFTSIYKFSVVWDTKGDTKIIVPANARNKIDGLCGYFDGDVENDQQMPEGGQADCEIEFVESWGDNRCLSKITTACKKEVYEESMAMCQKIKEGPVMKCDETINIDKLVLFCVESVCSCLETGENLDGCRCQGILQAVNQCRKRQPSLDLSQWQFVHQCHVSCPPGFVYKECFNRECEITCSNLMVPEACSKTEECFPGCYCPEGFVRDGEKCVLPSQCRDCVCDSYGQSEYITFDRNDFAFSGNCTYVLAKTIENYSGDQFKVLGTNGQCIDNPDKNCLNIITVLTKEHSVQIINDKNRQVIMKIDGTEVAELPSNLDWIKLGEAPGKCLVVGFPKLQLDVEFYGKGKGFYIRLPSYLYSGHTEGFCGNCNLNREDDFKKPDGSIAKEVNEFANSWQEMELPGVLNKEEMCMHLESPLTCSPPPHDKDPCLRLMDETLFGKCHSLVNPTVYMANCHMHLCKEENLTTERNEHFEPSKQDVCYFLEAYVRECQEAGLCLDWRSEGLCPFHCPQGLIHKPCGTSCIPTCQNYKLYKETPNACSANPGDMCACPNNKILHNGNCVEERQCNTCDDSGHFPGDEWSPDPCTKCTCTQDSVQCKQVECPTQIVCSEGHKITMVEGTEQDCCPKYICVPNPEVGNKCPETNQPKCGDDQVMTVNTGESGCQRFVCQCKPAEECPNLEQVLGMPPMKGMQPYIDRRGCCPAVKFECKTNTCPPPSRCPQHLVPIRRDTELCCPEYKCGAPENTCLHLMEFGDNPEGGERALKPNEKYRVLKNVGENWNDGPCRVCHCKGPLQVRCSIKMCSSPTERKNFAYEPVYSESHKCCPLFKKTGCKMDDKLYQVGAVWQSPDKPCINYTCTQQPDGDINLQESAQDCKKDCPMGWAYEEPVKGSNKCCGECKPIGCLVKGTLHPKGETWKSEDNCTTNQCQIDNNQVQVISFGEQCPNIENCPSEKIYQEGCCKKCRIFFTRDQSSCIAENMPLDSTVRLIKIKTKEHGWCMNLDYIRGFTQCVGSCSSHIKYNKELDEFKKECNCCDAVSYKTIQVRLDCDNLTVMNKELKVPLECVCRQCG